jgi:hypothetical protein
MILPLSKLMVAVPPDGLSALTPKVIDDPWLLLFTILVLVVVMMDPVPVASNAEI